MLVTNDAEWTARARYLTTQAKDDPTEYVHNAVGYDYRLTNLLAAMGCAPMEQLDMFGETKRQIAKRYRESLISFSGIHLPEEADCALNTFWMYTELIDQKVTGTRGSYSADWPPRKPSPSALAADSSFAGS